jgi:hypothetical protein
MAQITDVTPRNQLLCDTISLSTKTIICKEESVQVSSSGTGIRSTARKYNVRHLQIRHWINQLELFRTH